MTGKPFVQGMGWEILLGQLLTQRLISFLDQFLLGLYLPAEMKSGRTVWGCKLEHFPNEGAKEIDHVWNQGKGKSLNRQSPICPSAPISFHLEVLIAPISEHPASQVLLCPCSSEQHQSWSRGRLLGVPRRAEPSRPLLRATLPPHSCSLHPSFLPSAVFSFFCRTPHSFILTSSALLLSLCPSPCASLSLFYSPSRYLPPLIIVLLPCGPSPPSPPSPAGVSIGCGRPFPATGAPLPLPEPRGWWGLRGAQTHGRGAEGTRIPRSRAPSQARHGGGDGQVRAEGLAAPAALGGARCPRERSAPPRLERGRGQA